MRTLGILALLAAVALAEKPKKSPRYAASWSEAVEEAIALNLPIVVHRHGFY